MSPMLPDIQLEEATPKYDKIRGWLILVATGLVLTPLMVLNFVVKDYLPIFEKDVWEVFTTPGNEMYHPLFAPLAIGELSFNIILIIYSIVVVVLFFQKKKIAPKLVILLYASYLVFLVADYFVAELIPFIAAQDDSDTQHQIIRAFFVCAIWIPYFIVSKRVKGTFVR